MPTPRQDRNAYGESLARPRLVEGIARRSQRGEQVSARETALLRLASDRLLGVTSPAPVRKATGPGLVEVRAEAARMRLKAKDARRRANAAKAAR